MESYPPEVILERGYKTVSKILQPTLLAAIAAKDGKYFLRNRDERSRQIPTILARKRPFPA